MKLRLMFAMLVAVGGAALTGCSDNSSMRFVIDSISETDGSGAPTGRNYIEADLVGNMSDDPCATIQDQAWVTVRLEKPGTGTLGPDLDGRVRTVTVDYFYYDPNDGQLKGPVALLSSKKSNFNKYLTSGGTTSFLVPVGTYVVKTWTYGYSDCFGIPGFSSGVVDRMVARITIEAEDDTGKKLSAQGSILIYFYNYGPGPDPTNPLHTCAGVPTATCVANLCP